MPVFSAPASTTIKHSNFKAAPITVVEISLFVDRTLYIRRIIRRILYIFVPTVPTKLIYGVTIIKSVPFI